MTGPDVAAHFTEPRHRSRPELVAARMDTSHVRHNLLQASGHVPPESLRRISACRTRAGYLRAFRCDLFLSADPPDAQKAFKQGVPSSLVLDPPERRDASAEEDTKVIRLGRYLLLRRPSPSPPGLSGGRRSVAETSMLPERER